MRPLRAEVRGRVVGRTLFSYKSVPASRFCSTRLTLAGNLLYGKLDPVSLSAGACGGKFPIAYVTGIGKKNKNTFRPLRREEQVEKEAGRLEDSKENSGNSASVV
jgi:hypothetical protein